MHQSLESGSLYERGELPDFADAVLGEGFFKTVERDGELVLRWDGFETDVQVIAQCIRYINHLVSAEPDITKLSRKHFRVLKQITTHSPLFKALDSDQIILSERHHGIKPLGHIWRVLKGLDLSKLPNTVVGARLKAFAILDALLHDVGKAMAVGFGDQERLRELMQSEKPPAKDSYRGHDSVSTLAVGEILKEMGTYFNDTPIFSNKDREFLLFCIRYHHIFSEMSEWRGGIAKMDFFLDVLRSYLHAENATEKLNPLHMLIVLYVFTAADLFSVTNGENGNWMTMATVLCNTLCEILEDEGAPIDVSYQDVISTYMQPVV